MSDYCEMKFNLTGNLIIKNTNTSLTSNKTTLVAINTTLAIIKCYKLHFERSYISDSGLFCLRSD